jgi:hypothetical protein
MTEYEFNKLEIGDRLYLIDEYEGFQNLGTVELAYVDDVKVVGVRWEITHGRLQPEVDPWFGFYPGDEYFIAKTPHEELILKLKFVK